MADNHAFHPLAIGLPYILKEAVPIRASQKPLISETARIGYTSSSRRQDKCEPL